MQHLSMALSSLSILFGPLSFFHDMYFNGVTWGGIIINVIMFVTLAGIMNVVNRSIQRWMIGGYLILWIILGITASAFDCEIPFFPGFLNEFHHI
jgi:hypothetical protein